MEKRALFVVSDNEYGSEASDRTRQTLPADGARSELDRVGDGTDAAIASTASAVNECGGEPLVEESTADKHEQCEKPGAMPGPLMVKFSSIGVIGVVILMIAAIGAIARHDITVLNIGLLGLIALGICAWNFVLWASGGIVRHYVTCIAVTRYLGGFGPYNVTFVDNDTGKQYVASVDVRDCPYARGVRYVIYTHKEFQGRVLAYEDTEFDPNASTERG